jgi:hypothetical protein
VRVDWPLAQTIVVPAVVALPVRKGQRLGRIEVRSNGVVVARETLVAAESEARPNIIGRAEWYTARAAHNLIRLP